MKLYHCPPTRSQRALWALHEAGLDFEAIHVDLFQGAQHEPAYREVQSRGVVPALATEHGVQVESAAIAMDVFERAQRSGLAPEPGSPERGAYLQWCVYAPAELDPHLVTVTQNTMLLPEEQRDPGQVKVAKEALASRWAFVEEGLGEHPFLLGEHFSGADVVVGHACQWASMVGALDGEPVLHDYLARLAERPAFQRAYAS